MNETMNDLCRKVEKKVLRQIPTGHGVLTNKIYSKKDLMASLGIGEDAWKAMRATGLKAATAGLRIVVRGEEVARWVMEHEK